MNTKTLIYHPERWRFLRPPQEYNAFLRDNVETYQDLINDDGDLDLLLPWYEECGRNIFHLQPGLVELLANSSADDMTFAQLRSPYEALYLHWGRAGNVRTPDGCLFVEGAYVAFEDDNGELNLWVYLTTEYPEIDQARALPLPERLRRDCRGIDFSLFFAHPMATVKESIEDKFVNAYERMTEEEYNAAEQRLVDANIKEFPEFERAVNKTHAEAKADWILPGKEILWRESATAAINLVVNALCYLAYDGREVDCRYPDNAPANLVRQALGANRKDAQRASSKLAAVGFRKVHICGESLKTRGQATHTGSAKATHWRRGHWRHQAYGTGWQQRKLVWIMPALVGRDEQPVAGHLYEVVH